MQRGKIHSIRNVRAISRMYSYFANVSDKLKVEDSKHYGIYKAANLHRNSTLFQSLVFQYYLRILLFQLSRLAEDR